MGIARVTALVAATVSTGLMAGLYFAFAVAVMPGLRQVDDRAFVAAMRRINGAIVNGLFLLCFLGALLFPAVAVVLLLGRPALPWTVAALVLYAVSLGITGRINIPLNNALDAAGDGDPAPARTAFEARWVRFNAIRLAVTVAAFGCMIGALVRYP